MTVRPTLVIDDINVRGHDTLPLAAAAAVLSFIILRVFYAHFVLLRDLLFICPVLPIIAWARLRQLNTDAGDCLCPDVKGWI